MSLNSRIYFVICDIVGFVAELFSVNDVTTTAVEAADIPSQQEVFLSASVPEKNHMRPVSVLPVTVEGQIVGRVGVDDDSTTQRSSDYVELSTNTGDLVAVSWFDRYSVEKTAIDRRLLEDRDETEGILVVVLDGEAV